MLMGTRSPHIWLSFKEHYLATWIGNHMGRKRFEKYAGVHLQIDYNALMQPNQWGGLPPGERSDHHQQGRETWLPMDLPVK